MQIASAATTVKFHQFPSGTVVHNYQSGSRVEGPIRSISWSKEGNWLAITPFSGQIEIVTIKEQLRLIHTIQQIEEPSCAAFQNTTKKCLAIGTKNGQVLVYDIKARGIKKRFSRPSSMVTHVEFLARDGHVVAACENGEGFIYSNVSNTLSATFKVPKSDSISALKCHPIKRTFITAGSNEGVVAVWDINNNKHKFYKEAHKAPVTAVAFSTINSDFVISTGLDRQCCFYDMSSNKCIASILVDNSITAVDFSPDGKFIAMGSQKGKVLIYDSRSIKEPIHTFAAHITAIKHLSFQKMEEAEESFFSGIEEKQETTKPVKPQNESFGVIFGPTVEDKSLTNEAVDDSFMGAMGLNNNNTQEDNLPVMSKTETYQHLTPNKFAQDKFALMEKPTKQASSTPIVTGQELKTPISPIHSLNQASIEGLLKDTVKQEMKTLFQELRKDIQFNFAQNLAQMRQIHLNLQMSMVKESIKVENHLNNLRSELLTCDLPQTPDSLFEENAMLKRRIVMLEEKLLELKSPEN